MAELQGAVGSDPVDSFAKVIEIANDALAERGKAEADLKREMEKSKQAREEVLASDARIKQLQDKLSDFRNLNHHEAALLLSRCRDFTDGLRKKAEFELNIAKNEKGQSINERQKANDLVKLYSEKLAIVESKGREVLEKVHKEEENSKQRKANLEKDCNVLEANRKNLERENAFNADALAKRKQALKEAEAQMSELLAQYDKKKKALSDDNKPGK